MKIDYQTNGQEIQTPKRVKYKKKRRRKITWAYKSIPIQTNILQTKTIRSVLEREYHEGALG